MQVCIGQTWKNLARLFTTYGRSQKNDLSLRKIFHSQKNIAKVKKMIKNSQTSHETHENHAGLAEKSQLCKTKTRSKRQKLCWANKQSSQSQMKISPVLIAGIIWPS